MSRPEADLLLTNGTVITCNDKDDIIKSGAVAVTGDTITAVGNAESVSTWRAGEVIDVQGGIIMPGLINTHTHLPMSIFRGLADDLPLMTWLSEHIFPAEANHISAETAETGALLSCAEMLLSGTTTCCDGYFYEGAVASAVQQIGMRAVLGHGVIDHPAPGVPDPKANVETAVQFAEAWLGKTSLVTPSIFCHSPYTCSPETLKRAKAAARDLGILFQIHAAETRSEKDLIPGGPGLSPIQFLDRQTVLDSSTLIVHAVWVSKEDIQTIADRGAAVSHNPESNMKLAAGVAPVPEMIAAGIPVGLGTDGCASNNDLDLFREMDTAAKLHKVTRLDPTCMDAPAVLKMATIEGARAIGLHRQIGSLEPGKQADIIVLDTRTPRLTPLYNPVSHLVYAVHGSDVRDVMVAGSFRVRNRKLIAVDLEALLSRAVHLEREIGKSGRAPQPESI